MTALSIAVARLLAGSEIVRLLAYPLHPRGWSGAIAGIGLNTAGCLVAGRFGAVWDLGLAGQRNRCIQARSEASAPGAAVRGSERRAP
ncbi:MAG TPA: hypothetical protein VKV21_08735 [Solirubrobacteraceae bacterium]|nr:hypothetical protein [Solirubrobacteraceae bacterium]